MDTLQPSLINDSNGRMYEGGGGRGLDYVYSGSILISDRVAESRIAEKWATQGLQPNFVHLSELGHHSMLLGRALAESSQCG